MEFGILGPVEARRDGVPVRIGAARQRALLGILLLHAGEVLSTDRIVEALWGEQPPRQAVKTVQVYVSELRKALAAPVIRTRPPGYVVEVEPGRLDVDRFEQIAADGRRMLAEADPAGAASALRSALGLWRGPPLADVADELFAAPELARLEEVRLAALEDCFDAELAAGRAAELVGELEALIARQPLRERPRAQLMLALYRAGRQAEALDVYRQTRATLVEQLGIEPGPQLRELEQAILRQEQTLSLTRSAAAATVVPARSGTFVGRERELGLLHASLERTLAGEPAVALVTGEPGIGKTRLLEEFSGGARDRGADVVVGRCWEAGTAPAYWPWVEILRAYRRGAAPAPAPSSDLTALLPQLQRLPADDAAGAAAARFAVFDAVSSTLLGAADEHPLVVVLDDLHAADAPSLELLRFFSREIGGARVLIVGAYRDSEPAAGPLETVVAQLARDRPTVRAQLGGLEADDVSRFVELSLGEPRPGVAAELHGRTEGHPLFLVELVRLLRSDRRHQAAHRAIPDGVREVIGLRLQRLSAGARAVLDAGSVLGGEFAVEVLERLPALGDEAVLADVDEAVAARLLSQGTGGPGRLRFSHALVRDAVYRALAPGRRIELHRGAGETLEAVYARDLSPHLATLAQHFFEAGRHADAVKAAAYAEAAGRRAMAQFAHEDAAARFELALVSLGRTLGRHDREPVARQDLARWLRDREDRATAVRYAQLAGERARARFRNDEAIECYRLALDLGGAPGEVVREIAERLGDLLALTGRHDDAREAFARASAEDRSASVVDRARLERRIGDTLQVQVRTDEALEHYARAAGLLDAAPAGERDAAWQEEWLAVRLERMAAHYWAGQVDEMATVEREVRPTITATTPAVQRIRYFHLATDLRLRQTRYRIDERTLELARAHLAAAEELRSPRHIADAQFEVAFSELFHGDLDDAEARLRRSLARAEHFGDAVGRLRRLAYLTFLERLRGRPQETQDVCRALAEASTQVGVELYRPLIEAQEAWVAWRGGAFEEAARLAAAALEGWRRAGIDWPFEWTARYVLLACAVHAGDRSAAAAQAQAMLGPAQQVLPDDLRTALAGDADALRAAVALARARGYL